MITLLFWCILNGFLFHFNPNAMAEDTKILIHVISIASDTIKQKVRNEWAL